jgi:hypothetical protein
VTKNQPKINRKRRPQGIATKTFRNITEADVLSKLKKIDDAISVLDDNLAESLVTIFEAKVFSNII